MYKFLFFLISTFLWYNPVHSQGRNYIDTSINNYDRYGKKTGFWIDSSSVYKTEHYFRQGKKNGVEIVYYKNGRVGFFGTYKNDHLTGIGYFFNYKGRLTYTISYMGFVIYKGTKYQKGLFKFYADSGEISKSGIALFKEGDEELGEEIRLGKWK